MRRLSPQDLLALVSQGAEVSKKDDKPKVIEGFDALVSQMEAMVKAQKESADSQRELLTAVMGRLSEALEQFKGGTVDLKPLESLVKQIESSHQTERLRYDFQVKRNQRGLLTGMTAIPEKHTIN
jgi:hypothetical protein